MARRDLLRSAERVFGWIDRILRLFEWVLIVSAAIFGGWLAWAFTGELEEISLLMRIGVSLASAAVMALVGWIGWLVLRFLN